jgi:flagellar motility protein MotE (MotC chaperone)
MSSRNAALILEEMPDGLSVEILQGLSNEARASILGRMDPRVAARLVSIMSVQ